MTPEERDLQNSYRKNAEAYEYHMTIKWSVIGVALFLLLIMGGMVGCPRYKVYQQNLRGKADLAEATQNRQIAIQEAMAKFESAVFIKQSDSTRAVGVAIANKIIGQSLKENEDYLRWLWITDVAGASVDKTIVYIPTETNLPILEANRLAKPPVIQQTVEKEENTSRTIGSTIRKK